MKLNNGKGWQSISTLLLNGFICRSIVQAHTDAQKTVFYVYELLNKQKQLDKVDRDVLYKQKVFYTRAMHAESSYKKKKMIYLKHKLPLDGRKLKVYRDNSQEAYIASRITSILK